MRTVVPTWGCDELHSVSTDAAKLNRERAQFVLSKLDEILAWVERKDTERDTKFVELGRYLCEAREGQYLRLEKFKSFD